ncbi:MAG: hypothetical protein QM621_00605 [Aeromicrobium sp.]|uniref:hypothetical protein n=1 Tax=Aeromicrobium sp. TaxID=1871063 RepID=UPI0039E2E93C
MRIGIHPHALKHGLTPEQIVRAVETGIDAAQIRNRDQNTDPQRWGVIGFDNTAREIQLVIIHTTDGVLVIHANYLTEGFRKEMRNAR